MLAKFIYTFSLTVTILLLLHSRSFAFSVDVVPREVSPGDVFLLRARFEKPASDVPVADFAGRKTAFSQDAETLFIALLAVDIDTSPGNYPVTISAGGETRSIQVKIKPYRFPTKKLTLPEEKVTLSPEDLKRAETEKELMDSTLSTISGRQWKERFSVPTGTAVSEDFGVKRIMNEKTTSIHRGTDYRGETGTPVKAVNSGTVVLREDMFFGGNTVVIDHGMGLFSIYMHLSGFRVEKGDKVSKGQVIGLMGMTGRATGPHLHFGVKLQGVSVNPMSLFIIEL